MNNLPSYSIQYYDELDSIQLEARRKIIESTDALHGQIICTTLQTSKYGKYERSWQYNKGDFAYSIISKPGDCSHISQLCYIAALAIEATLKKLSPMTELQFKWVNDILVKDRKIAGVLLEKAAENFVILSIGINLLPKVSTTLDAISLKELRLSPSIPELAEILAQKFQYFYNLWISKGFAPIRSQWLYSAKGLDHPITITLPDKKRHGIFLGIDDDGSLLMMENITVKTINTGELFLDDSNY